MDQRLKQIIHWLETELKNSIDTIETASADASFRRYFRVTFTHSTTPDIGLNDSYIVMDAPPPQENIKPFINISNIFKNKKIHVPTIYEQDINKGFILMEDFGSTPYLSILNQDNVDDLYGNAFKVLYKLTNIQEVDLPIYDRQKLQSEMDLYLDWYIQVHLNTDLSDKEKNILKVAQNNLIELIEKQPKVIVHRDFHSRNLMFVEENNPGVIDFQDAVIGPCTYDLVSLIRDSYIKWPEDKIDQWLLSYQYKLHQHGIIPEMAEEAFKKWLDIMGMQRQLKVVGIFSRLYHRDGKENYLDDIPLTYQNLLNSSQRYPEFDDLTELLNKYKPR